MQTVSLLVGVPILTGLCLNQIESLFGGTADEVQVLHVLSVAFTLLTGVVHQAVGRLHVDVKDALVSPIIHKLLAQGCLGLPTVDRPLLSIVACLWHTKSQALITLQTQNKCQLLARMRQYLQGRGEGL